MKNVLKTTLIDAALAIAVFLAFYLAGVFIAWQPDVTQWHYSSRALLVVLSVLGSGLLLGVRRA